MRLFEVKKDGNRRIIKFCGIKISYRRKILLTSVNLSKKRLKEKASYYNDYINKILTDADKFKNIKIEIPQEKQKLTDFKLVESARDPMGCVLIKGDEIYRGVHSKSINSTIELLNSGLLQLLTSYGLIVQTDITKFYTDEFPLILKHNKLRIIDPSFWTFTAGKDAAISMIIINKIAEAFGYALIDGHPFNLTFDNNKPVFFDIGSFIKLEVHSVFTNEIINEQILPLAMQMSGNSYLAKRINVRDFLLLTNPSCSLRQSFEIENFLSEFIKHHKSRSSNTYNMLIKKLFDSKPELKPEYVDLLLEYQFSETMWNDYSDEMFDELKNSTNIPQRFERLIELIEQYSPDAKSIVDLAGNAGYFCQLLNNSKKNYDELISTDYDMNAVEIGYNYSKSIGNKVENFVMNFILPALCDSTYPMFKSDVAVSLAVTHHLLLTQEYRIDTVLNQIRKYAKKQVYVEFCPLGMWGLGQTTKPSVPDWYREDWFEENFKKYFKLLHKEVLETAFIEGIEETHRVIYVGEII